MSGASRVSRSSRLTKLRVTPLGLGQFRRRPVSSLLQHPLPPMRPRQRADQRLVRPRLRRRPGIAAVRRDDHLAAAAALEGHRDADGDRRAVEFPILAGHLPLRLHAALTSRDCSSSTSVWSPSARSRTCMPSGERSTRSTSSRTIRACSAGKSSSHKGAKSVTVWTTSRSGTSSSFRAAAHVRAMISGVRSRCRTCATTASSTSAAGTLRTGHSE